ncbi:MAG TPA: EscU/YscU/HrcU family type III secretion system export apparatus switch protein, partial [Thermoanaerobacterales bacterium]|nr:EscU/YscU/HrcU family type III secretion system export apparatus switch protein [Thermoanaerobacterales bacterium]
MNLQFFAQERTEKATPRRRQKAREKGQVFSSRELNSALGLLASFLLLRIVGKNLCINAINFFYHILNDYINIETFNNEEITILFFEIIIFMGKALLPVLSAAFVVSLFSNYMQVGFVLTLDTISPKLERINPIEGFKRIFSRRSLV